MVAPPPAPGFGLRRVLTAAVLYILGFGAVVALYLLGYELEATVVLVALVFEVAHVVATPQCPAHRGVR